MGRRHGHLVRLPWTDSITDQVPKVIAILLGMQQDSFQSERLAVHSTVGEVVIRRGVTHHFVDAGLRFVTVDYWLLPEWGSSCC